MSVIQDSSDGRSPPIADAMTSPTKHSIVQESIAKCTACTRNAALFDDLSQGEFFSPSVLEVDRVLAVDDDEVDGSVIDWERAKLPGREEQEEEVEQLPQRQMLHGAEGFLTVKVWYGRFIAARWRVLVFTHI